MTPQRISPHQCAPTDPHPLGPRLPPDPQTTICGPWLLGQCPGRGRAERVGTGPPRGGERGYLCPLHHTRYPYHWQLLARGGTREWQSLPEMAQDQLERVYCTGATIVQLGRSRSDPCVLHLNGSRVEAPDFIRWRRLTTSSCPEESPHFFTQWVTYRKIEGRWCPYQEPLASEIEASYLGGRRRFRFALGGSGFVINWALFRETDLTRGHCRKMCRRPRYRSPLDMLPYLRTLSPLDRPREPLHHSPGPAEGGEAGAAPQVDLPASPERRGAPFSLVPLSLTDGEYQMAYWMFHRTVPESQFIVSRVSRVVNPALWQEYVKRRAALQEKLGDSFPPGSWDRHLFHGTSEACALSICRWNFDPGLGGRHGARYGKGACFASTSGYSHGFASPSESPVPVHRMFLAKVLTGRSALGRPHLPEPPLLGPEPSGGRYDSCVDSLEEPSIFVIFDSSQCYPSWLIEYQAVTSIVLD